MDINNMKEKLFNFTEHFASRTGDYALITKLTMEIKSYETKVHSLYGKLGKMVYEKTDKAQDGISIDNEIKELLDRIADYMTKIEDTHRTIAEIRKKAEAEMEEQNSSDSAAEKEKETPSEPGETEK